MQRLITPDMFCELSISPEFQLDVLPFSPGTHFSLPAFLLLISFINTAPGEEWLSRCGDWELEIPASCK